MVRVMTTEHLVKQYTQGVDIRLGFNRLGLELFRRGISHESR